MLINKNTILNIVKQLENFSNPEKKNFFPTFFKTGKGEYGEGDLFLGVTVPNIRKVAKKNLDIGLPELNELIQNPYHECRACALIILVTKFKKSQKEKEKEEIYNFYLSHTSYINNWDLVDISAKDIVGSFLRDKDRSILYKLSESLNLWEQRISIISTYAFIKEGDLSDTFALSEKFIQHTHDLIHKATGWMLREAGKRDKNALCSFLNQFAGQMPRTMLRYSIEKFTPDERKYYLNK